MSLAVHVRSLPQPRWLKPAPSSERHLDRRPSAAIYKSIVRSTSSIFGSGVDLRQRQQVLRVLRVPELWHGSGAVAPLKDLRGDLLAGLVLDHRARLHQ